MFQFKKTVKVPFLVEEVFKFSTNIYNICKMVPDYIKVRGLTGSESLKTGDRVNLNINIAGFNFMWESVILDFKSNEYFVDRMIRGPFKSWEHRHFFKKSDEGGTIVTDIVNYSIPFGLIGYAANKLFVERMIEEIFTFRHEYKNNNINKSCEI